MTQVDPRKVLFLFSDTGGGHRSAAEAISEALQLQTGPAIQTEMVDFLREYSPWPYRKFPELYRELMRRPALWGGVYYATNGKYRNRFLTDVNRLNPMLMQQQKEMLRRHPADLIVLTHFFAIHPLQWLRKTQSVRTCVVVTDLVTTHASWFHPDIDHYIVPTNVVRDTAISHGVAPEKIEVLGLPISPRFRAAPVLDKIELRTALGWNKVKPVALLMGGGDGMGAVSENVAAIAAAGLDLELAVVTGRNQVLEQQLRRTPWQIPVHVYGFVRNIPDLMCAADVLITKAGPSTICEGLACGLPIIIYSYLPGQEVGNVRYLEQHKAGCFAGSPRAVVQQLAAILEAPQTFAHPLQSLRDQHRNASVEIAAAIRSLATK